MAITYGQSKGGDGPEWLRSARRLAAPVIALIVLAAVFAAISRGRYVQPESLRDIGEQATLIVIVGIGETLVIIAGGIDLSVGAVVAFTGTLAAVLMLQAHWSPVPAALAGTAAGGAVGFCNGFVSVKTRLHSFITTLGSMMIFRGLALSLTDAQNTGSLPDSFGALSTSQLAVPLPGGRELAMPILVVYIIVLGAAAHLLLTRTRFGRYCFAIGSSREGSRLSGIRVELLWTTLYFVVAGLLFGFGGVVQAARLGIGQPTVGDGMELEAIAAAVIGGTSLLGGQGSIGGTIVGAILMAALRQGLRMQGLQPHWQTVALGSAIILAVIYDRASRGRRE